MNKRRLLKLADLLEADAKNKKGVKFDLGIWAGPSDRLYNNFNSEDQNQPVPVSCATSACAIGLACISGAFKRSGLEYEFQPIFGYSGFRMVPKFGRKTEFDAVEEFFNLDRGQSEFLFLDGRYPDGKTTGAVGERYVAKRIRDFVAGKVSP